MESAARDESGGVTLNEDDVRHRLGIPK